MRRQVQLRPISPRTADELAGFFRDVSYTLTDVRQGEAVPPIKVERVPADLGTKDGSERKALFITALLPVMLEVNQRVLAEREQLLFLRDKMRFGPACHVADRAHLARATSPTATTTPVDKIDELVRRVDIVPPSMAIAQSGVESGWGTSFAARTGNALFGQIQPAGATRRRAVEAGCRHAAAFHQCRRGDRRLCHQPQHPSRLCRLPRRARAALRERGETLTAIDLIGSLLRYSELGQEYVRFVRQIMRENELTDFDKAGCRVSEPSQRFG